MKLTGQDIANQMKAKADAEYTYQRLLSQVRRYWPLADAKYDTVRITDELTARGVTDVAQVSWITMDDLRLSNKR